MARAETIESVGETGGGGGAGGNPPLPHQNSCRMELPRPLHTWPSFLATTTITTSTGAGAVHHHHPLHPLEALYLSYPPLPYPHPENRDESYSHQQFPASSPSPTPPPSPLCNRRGDRMAGSEFSDLDREQHMEASSRRQQQQQQQRRRRQGPLPDLLPQNEASPHHRVPRGEAVQEMELRRVANQLRAIGDDFNSAVLRRAHIAPQWRNWRDVCRGLLNFIAQTLSPLYRLT